MSGAIALPRLLESGRRKPFWIFHSISTSVIPELLADAVLLDHFFALRGWFVVAWSRCDGWKLQDSSYRSSISNGGSRGGAAGGVRAEGAVDATIF